MPGTLFVVATPIGNLEDITIRALRVLREVAVIAAEDTRRTAHLLARHGITTSTTSLHEHNEAGKSGALIARIQAGESIALVSDAGTPTVSDPGGILIRAAIDAGLRVEPVPGPSAILAALAASGLPTSEFSFLGFPPIKSSDRKRWFAHMKAIGGTIVFFEAPHRILETLGELERQAGSCSVAVCREVTKLHEQWVRGPINEVLRKISEGRGEFTVVVYLSQITQNNALDVSPEASVVTEFGQLTKLKGVTKRKAIGILSKRRGIAPNRIYELLEQAKKSAD